MKRFLMVSGLLVMGACGPELTPVEQDNDPARDSSDSKTMMDVEVQVNFVNKNAKSFALAAAEEYLIRLEGCASGHTTTATQLDADLKVYKNDKNCLAKLENMVFDGATYLPTVADPFETWEAGDSATFENGTGDKLRLVVAAQLANPVATTEPITYTFSMIDKGDDDTIDKPTTSDGHVITVEGQDAPAFEIQKVTYDGMTDGGAGKFIFFMNCLETVTGSVATTNIACKGLPLTAIDYKLIKDTYSSTLTLDQASAEFPTGEISIDLAEYLDPGADATNGGFKTKVVVGPDQMHNNPNMMIIFEAVDTSFLYFNVDVETLP